MNINWSVFLEVNCKKMGKTLVLIVVFTFNLYTFGQVVAPCDDDYGSSSDEDNIMLQMRFGTLTDALQAIE